VSQTTVADFPPEQSVSERHLLGARLRQERQRRGIGVRELARQTNCSASLISQIELGKIAPSVSTLYALTSFLGVSMDSLFATEEASIAEEAAAPEPQRAPVRAVEAAEGGVVQRRHSRPHISLQQGVRWERLNPLPESGAEFLEVTYDVGGGTRSDAQAIRHNGREYGLLLAGELTVQIGFEVYVLKAGDSVAFDSTIPHRYWNSGDGPVRAIWFELKPGEPASTAGPLPGSAHSLG
jgi:transcriptional regulator with XRE-family HTH domain